MEISNQNYKHWLRKLKLKFRSVQQKAVIAVNQELLKFYWELGADVVEQQKESRWGDGFLKQLSDDLKKEFPDVKGFSLSNIKYIKQWYSFYNGGSIISQQLVGQITSIPWGHNIAIISKCKSIEEASYYVNQTILNGWSRNVLIHQIEHGLHFREGKAVTNFQTTLPKIQSDLANQSLKDPYIFDFLSMTNQFNEYELEKELINHMTDFLLELGSGFAYIGKQVPVKVGDQEFRIDLLFYHTHLHCYVVIELKADSFKPEYAGKLNFYINVIDDQFKKEQDAPTIGILLCKGKNKLVAEYALHGIHKPIGVSEYQLTQSLPESLKRSLPSIELLEKELKKGNH